MDKLFNTIITNRKVFAQFFVGIFVDMKNNAADIDGYSFIHDAEGVG